MCVRHMTVEVAGGRFTDGPRLGHAYFCSAGCQASFRADARRVVSLARWPDGAVACWSRTASPSARPSTRWAVLHDVEQTAPCLPGAELAEVVDEKTWKARST